MPDAPYFPIIYVRGYAMTAGEIDKTTADPFCGFNSLAYTLTLGVRVPEFEVERKFWADRHYEGGYLFRDSLVLEITPPKADEDWQVAYDWQSDKPGLATRPLDTRSLAAGRAELSIAFDSETTPGIRGRLQFIVAPRNR